VNVVCIAESLVILPHSRRKKTIPESSIIIEYLAQHYPGKMQLVPTDADLVRQMRFRDRFYDLYVQEPMQKIVTDRLRPAGKDDPHGVEQAKGLLQAAYGMKGRGEMPGWRHRYDDDDARLRPAEESARWTPGSGQ
jgi:glutathione S-transferase